MRGRIVGQGCRNEVKQEALEIRKEELKKNELGLGWPAFNASFFIFNRSERLHQSEYFVGLLGVDPVAGIHYSGYF